MTLVSVIIPTYNRASLVPRAIASVLSQTHRPIELLVVDDASTDNTEAVVRAIGAVNLRYVKHARNQGQCAAINTGIAAASGEFVSFLDSDDEWRPEMVRKQLEVFSSHGAGMGAVYTWAGALEPDGSLTPSHLSRLQGRIHRDALAQGHVAHSIALLVRRGCFDRVGPFDTQFASFQDDDLCFRLAKEYEFGLVPEMLAVIHPGAADRLTTDRRPYAKGWRDLLRKHEADILAECGVRVLSRHYFRAGLLCLDAGERREALASFGRAFRLAPSFKALGGIVLSPLPFVDVWLSAFRARPGKGLRGNTPAVGEGSQ